MNQVKLNTGAAKHEGQARQIADALRRALPENLGFTLFIFDQGKNVTEGDPTFFTYISTASREDMVSTLRAWLAKVSP